MPIPQDILFVDNANYLWGIYDEVGTTAFYAGRPQVGMSACEKILKEPHLPPEHRERVTNNYNIYLKHMLEFQEKMLKEQMQKNEEIAKKVKKSTLEISPEAVNLKL
jgi:hypothetical protein